MKMYAAIDPNWGKPRVVVQTIADSEDAAKSLAINNRDLAFYSGASFDCIPMQPGQWKHLASQGYVIEQVEISICNQQ